jgi:hypothetical protein
MDSLWACSWEGRRELCKSSGQNSSLGSALLWALSVRGILIWVPVLFLCEILFLLPLQYEVRGVDSSFFVDDSEAAEKLANADRKITTIQGFKVC